MSRLATPTPAAATDINDLPNDIILRILEHLGLRQNVDAAALRRMHPAFQAAATCTRWYTIFMHSIVTLDTNLVAFETKCAPTHDAMRSPHITWLCRNAPNLTIVELTQFDAHAVNALHAHTKLEKLTVSAEQDWPAIKKLSPSVTKLDVMLPSLNTLKLLAGLSERCPGVALKKLFLSVELEHMPTMRRIFRNIGATLSDVYAGFTLPSDSEKHREGMDKIIGFITDVCDNCYKEMPNIEDLAFSVPSEYSFNQPCHQDLGFLVDNLADFRAYNPEKAPSKIRALCLYTEAESAFSWLEATRTVMTSSVFIVLEAGLDIISFGPPAIFSGEHFFHIQVRLKITNATLPLYSRGGYRFVTGKLNGLVMCERTFVERFVLDSEFRKKTLYFCSKAQVDILKLLFPLTSHVEQLALSLEPDSPMAAEVHAEVVHLQGLLLSENATQTTAEESTFEFFKELLPSLSEVRELVVSFELITLVLTHAEDVRTVLELLPNLEKLRFIMPTAVPEVNQIDSGIFKVTETFLLALPPFLCMLVDNVPKLVQLNTKRLAKKITWECPIEGRMQLFADVFQAMDEFEEKRPKVFTESLRVLLEVFQAGTRKSKLK